MTKLAWLVVITSLTNRKKERKKEIKYYFFVFVGHLCIKDLISCVWLSPRSLIILSSLNSKFLLLFSLFSFFLHISHSRLKSTDYYYYFFDFQSPKRQ